MSRAVKDIGYSMRETSAPECAADTEFSNLRLQGHHSASVPGNRGPAKAASIVERVRPSRCLLVGGALHRLDERGDLAHHGLRQNLILVA